MRQIELEMQNKRLDQRGAEQTQAIEMLHDIATIANHAQNAEQAIEYCLRRVAMSQRVVLWARVSAGGRQPG